MLEPDRLTAMLRAYVQSAAAQSGRRQGASSPKLRHDHTAAEAGIARLLELVEKGLMEAEDPAMRERLVGLKLQRDQIAKEIGGPAEPDGVGDPDDHPGKGRRVGGLLRDKLYEGPAGVAAGLRPAAAWTKSGSPMRKSASAARNPFWRRCALEGVAEPAPKVLSFVQEWRARQDSNL